MSSILRGCYSRGIWETEPFLEPITLNPLNLFSFIASLQPPSMGGVYLGQGAYVGLNDPSRYPDRALDWMEFWHGRRSQQVRQLVTQEVVAEHAGDPAGDHEFHSGELTQVLNYLRMAPTPGKEFAYMTVPFHEYRIGIISPRGEEVEYPVSETFNSEDEIVHEIFLRRLRKIGVNTDEVTP